MTVQITILGLGQIGASIGLSLAKRPDRIQRVGYDCVLGTQNKAKALGACDTVKFNLPSAIQGADVVLVCVPLDQVDETFKLIAPDLREDAVVMDFSAQKTAAYQWFKQNIPAGRHYIGLVPAVNPSLLDLTRYGIESARADLFEGASMGIAAPSGSSSQALKLAADLVEMIGAQAIYIDILEADGVEMTTHLLPQVMSAALLNATVGQPGWAEARRFAGCPFAQASAALGADTLEGLTQALLLNPLVATSVLDNAIGALTYLRTAVSKGDQEDLQNRLQLAFTDREQWLNERLRADWDKSAENSKAPYSGDVLKRIFLGGLLPDKKKGPKRP